MATFVLVPGAWLGGWAWRTVTGGLRAAGHDVHPLTLTGVADRSHLARPGVDLDTHAADIVGLVEAEELTDVFLVGHSHGGIAASAAADRIPDRLTRVVYVDSGPLPDGMAEIDLWPAEEQERVRATTGADGRFAPRRWDPAADPHLLAGLDADALDALRRRATPHPAGSVTQPMARQDKPYGGPVTLVACTIPLDQVLAMRAAGHPYFALMPDADVVGLPTGHWPMFSEPAKLTEVLDGLTRPAAGA
ncbi:MAG TPA: alpha/beta hydrolase [Micromonosporaceae bacterium]|nr:alpha/beta hydrolase [Micromonosporaceae bacterium]